ncbi:MAG: phenylacetate-CoA ligase [Planctomycetota bacterium]|jgi:phenylacetate-CoA ligase
MEEIKYKSIYKAVGIILYYFRYSNTQFWSEKKIEKYQIKRLQKQLIQASKTQYYNELFKELNFNPKTDFKSLNDLDKIPVTEKNKVKENTDLFINNKYQKKSLPFYTSGSTGNPMKALIHPLHWVIEQAVIFRHWSWGGYHFRDATAMLRSYSPKEGEPLTKYSRPLNTTYFSPFHLTEESMMMYYNLMIDLKTRVLRGYPSSVKIFALFLKKNNLKIKSIKQILVASEVLTDNDRNIIESVFDCKISNHYGLAEQIVMFGDCEKHTHLHNYFEYGYVELLDTDRPNIKKIIGTNLHNKTMPIIRYDTGDLAIIDNTKCNCKRNGVVIKNIIGRNNNNIECPDKSTIPTVNFFTMLEDFLEFSSWQIIYTETELIVNYILVDNITKDRLSELRQRLDQRVNHTGFKTDFKEVSELHKTSEGKLKTILKKT